METYFVFSDETGNYEREKSEHFLKRCPFYVRAGLMINPNDWKIIDERKRSLKEKRGFSKDKEIKWSYLWSIFKAEKNNEIIEPNKPYKFLEQYGFDVLKEYIEETLSVLNELASVCIILTVTKNACVGKITFNNLLKMHLQDLMQRVEMETQRENALAVFFFDPIRKKSNEILEAAYAELYANGDFFTRYSHIKDTLSFEPSHHSAGIQMADFICGAFCGTLRGFETSKSMFTDHVLPSVSKASNSDPMGYGIVEIPKDEATRKEKRELLYEELN